MAEVQIERIDLPRDGYSVMYKPETHAYHRVNDRGLCGYRLPGASTIAKAFPDSNDGLMFWVEKMSLEGVARLSAAQVVIPDDPYALRGVLEKHELRWQQLRDAGGRRGTNVHEKQVHALATGQDFDLDQLSGDERGYGQAFQKWWLDRQPKATHAEQVVLSLEHGFAGRFDLRCTLGNPKDARYQGVGIVDAKTGKRPYRADHIQQRLYDIASRECFVGENDWLMVLQLCPDGNYIEHYCAATEEQALLALKAYNEAKTLDREMKAA